MGSENGKPLDHQELVSLPADDPVRRGLALKLAEAPAAEREAIEAEWALSDRLRELLPQVEVPPLQAMSLEARLLEIPKGTAESAWRRMLLHPNWRHAAACVLIAGLVALYFLWPRESGFVMPPTLDESVGRSIAAWAVKNHEAALPLAVESGDPTAVQRALESKPTDFPVLMLKPADGVALQGGGTCDIGQAKAVFTRWRAGDITYTLYEFNGADVGAPKDFLTNIQAPKDLWHDDYRYRVVVWPGKEGKCCWALVMEKENATNIFARYGYRS